MIKIIDSWIKATRELVSILEDADNLISVSGIDMLVTLIPIQRNTSMNYYKVADTKLHESCLASIVDDMKILAGTRSNGYIDMYSDDVGLIRLRISQGVLEAYECSLKADVPIDLSTLI